MKPTDSRPACLSRRRLLQQGVMGLTGLAGLVGGGGTGLGLPEARAHHGWSSFDLNRPLYLEGRAGEVRWRNPHVELMLERRVAPVPADLARRPVPPQVAPVDGSALLARATVPQRTDARWWIELAPLTRMNQWKVPEIRSGATLAVLGFTFANEQGEAILRAEYLFLDEKVYGLRSSPAGG